MYYDDSSFRSPNESTSPEIKTDIQDKLKLEKCYALLKPVPPPLAVRKDTKATVSHFDPDNLLIGGACKLIC